MSLKNLQNNFIKTIFAQDEAAIENELVTDKISAHGLMDIYRGNSVGGIEIAMELTYPVVKKLVGEKFFNATTHKFWKENWPKSCNLDEYGGEFGDFLEKFEPAKSLPYLPDVARLEWLFHLSSIADKANVIDQEAIAQIPQEKYFELKFTLHPSVYFISSKFPIHKIWEMCQGGEEEYALNLDEEKGVDLMLVRKRRRVEIITLTPAEISFLKELKEGLSFYDAFESASNVDEEFDLAFYLSRHIVQGTFSGFLLDAYNQLRR